MKEFMENLYSKEYFGVTLFIVIGGLAVLFVIVLILALKDAKKRKKAVELTQESDKATDMAELSFAKNVTNPVNVEVNTNKQPEMESTVLIKDSTNGFEDIKVDAPTSINNETVSAFPEINVEAPNEIPD